MNICFYAASSKTLAAEYYESAEKIGRFIGEGGHTLVYGGGCFGLMGSVSRATRESGGTVIGVAPRFFDEEGALDHECDQLIYTENMRQRKAILEQMADVFIVAPGGIGTLEEFSETLTLKSLGDFDKPIFILNQNGLYNELKALLETFVERKFAAPAVLKMYTFVDTAEDLIAALEALK